MLWKSVVKKVITTRITESSQVNFKYYASCHDDVVLE